MSKLRFYVDFDALCGSGAADREDCEFLISRIFQGIHAAIVQECGDSATAQNSIAVSFPLADSDHHGGVLRVFSSSADVLGRLLRHPKIHRFIGVTGAEILEVPEVADFCIFRRNRSGDKASPSAIARAKLREKTHGFIFQFGVVNELGFGIKLQSESTGNQFVLHVKKAAVTQWVEGSFNAYGLSSSEAVPVF